MVTPKAVGQTASIKWRPDTSVFPQDGAGSDDQGRTTPAAMNAFLRAAATTSYGPTLYNSLPDFDVNGTIAGVLPKSPAAGDAQVRPVTGSWKRPQAR